MEAEERVWVNLKIRCLGNCLWPKNNYLSQVLNVLYNFTKLLLWLWPILQDRYSPYFCVFKYSRTVKQKVILAKTILRKRTRLFEIELWPTFWFSSFKVKTAKKDGRFGCATLNWTDYLWLNQVKTKWTLTTPATRLSAVLLRPFMVVLAVPWVLCQSWTLISVPLTVFALYGKKRITDSNGR